MDKFDLVRKAFPNGDMTRWDEVNGLGESALHDLVYNPEAVMVKLTLREYEGVSRNQYHFIILVDEYYVYGRLCDAYPDCGYAMYAALFEVVPCEDEAWLRAKMSTLDQVFSNKEHGYKY